MERLAPKQWAWTWWRRWWAKLPLDPGVGLEEMKMRAMDHGKNTAIRHRLLGEKSPVFIIIPSFFLSPVHLYKHCSALPKILQRILPGQSARSTFYRLVVLGVSQPVYFELQNRIFRELFPNLRALFAFELAERSSSPYYSAPVYLLHTYDLNLLRRPCPHPWMYYI